MSVINHAYMYIVANVTLFYHTDLNMFYTVSDEIQVDPKFMKSMYHIELYTVNFNFIVFHDKKT